MFVDGQFLVRDTDLARKLGFLRDRDIRKIIERSRTELEQEAPLRHRGAMVVVGSGAQREITEYFLNEGQALIIIGYSNAPDANAVKQLMRALFKSFVRGGQELTAEQAVDRLAADDTAYALSQEGAELGFRQAAALEA
jgi:hypothetical protein